MALTSNEIFSLINRSEKFDNKAIDIILCNDEPWFKGKDVAHILGYGNTRKALLDHIRTKYKKTATDLFSNVNGSNVSILPSMPNFQGKTIYICEAGLYQLIMSSKLEIAVKFQDWIFETLLPQLRRLGQERLFKELEAKDAELKIKDEKLARSEKIRLGLQTFVDNNRHLEKNQIFYLATTESYARQSRFEYGGVKTPKDIQARLNTYNTGRAEGDLMFMAHLFQCHNYKDIEDRVGTILARFKDKNGGKKEMVYLRYNLLVDIISFICDNYDREIDYINERCQAFLQETLEEDGIVPTAVDIDSFLTNELKVVYRQGGRERTKKIDVSGWSDEQIQSVVDEIIQKFTIERSEATRVSCKQESPLEFNWKELKPYLSLYDLPMREWRSIFREWYQKRQPKQLKVRGIKI